MALGFRVWGVGFIGFRALGLISQSGSMYAKAALLSLTFLLFEESYPKP